MSSHEDRSVTQAPSAAQQDATSAIDALAERYWESVLELSPITATFYGDQRFADRFDDPGPAGRARQRALAEDTIAAVDAFDRAHVLPDDAITLDMLRAVAEQVIEADQVRLHELQVVDQMSGPQTLLPQLCAFQPANTPEALERFVARLRAYPEFMGAYTQIVREALASGLTAPRIVAERTIAQLERMLAVPREDAIVAGAAQVAGDSDRDLVRDLVAEHVYPADQAFLDAIRGDYLAATREEPGLWSAPDGDALYRVLIRQWTTLDLDPNEVHDSGLRTIEVLENERRAIAREEGFGEDTVAYRRSLDEDAANAPASKAALVDRANEDIERARALAPAYFGRLPVAGVEVRAVEDFKEQDAPFAYYFPPSTDGTRRGVYYVNGYDLPSRKFTKLASTTYHEAIPGHHFQIALEMEHPGLNTFRRIGARSLAGAYVEGWGLYSERLADEMGLYRSEGERFGMLDAQAWRAARLVVDTGLHAKRWTRQRSIDFLVATGLSLTDATIETDRYIAMPAQALTYMIGQREISRLRAEIEARDGDRFDLRAFHDAVLGHGSLPLATLTRDVASWVRPRE